MIVFAAEISLVRVGLYFGEGLGGLFQMKGGGPLMEPGFTCCLVMSSVDRPSFVFFYLTGVQFLCREGLCIAVF
jgi:hypothetical protein